MTDTFDAVLVGAGPAGCTAAMLLGRAGLKVALLDAHRDVNHYKRLCTHSMRSSALPTLNRLGLDELLEERGAVRQHERVWTQAGWTRETRPNWLPSHGYNVSRRVLDPLMRTAAAAVDGVELMMGARLTGLTFDRDGRVDGVAADLNGSMRRIGAKLVVGADGSSSKVAQLASLPGVSRPNNRFVYFAEYRNVIVPPWCTTAMWLVGRDAAYVFCNEDGVTLLAAVPAIEHLPEFRQDPEAALLKMVMNLSDGPDLTRAERVSNVIGTTDYPFINRKRIVAPGAALIGDAAMVGDPLWGTGCGWAIQTAEWLCDAVSAALRDGTIGDVDSGGRHYQRQHKRRLWLHQFTNMEFARKLRLNPLERVVFAGAVWDANVAEQVVAVGSRNRSPLTFFSPSLLLRAATARQRSSLAGSRLVNQLGRRRTSTDC
jgi:flavin-dependent dehydrogenase